MKNRIKISSKDQFLSEECKKANLDAISMQDVNQIDSDSIAHLGYNLFLTGPKEKRQPRVGIAIRTSTDIVINNIVHQSERLIATDIVVNNCKLRVISA